MSLLLEETSAVESVSELPAEKSDNGIICARTGQRSVTRFS